MRKKTLIAAGFMSAVVVTAGATLFGSPASSVGDAAPEAFDLRRPFHAVVVETRRVDGKVTDRLEHEIDHRNSENFTAITTMVEGDEFDRIEETRTPGAYERIAPDAYVDHGDVVSPDDQVRRTETGRSR